MNSKELVRNMIAFLNERHMSVTIWVALYYVSVLQYAMV